MNGWLYWPYALAKAKSVNSLLSCKSSAFAYDVNESNNAKNENNI